jgi:hypothetical protein
VIFDDTNYSVAKELFVPVFASRLPDHLTCQILHAQDVAGYELRVWPRGNPGPNSENVARLLVPYSATRDDFEAAANKLIAAALERQRAVEGAT